MVFMQKWRNPSKTKTYYSWKSMRTRCLDDRHVAWAAYGGRGISVCARWVNDYDAFFEDMGECPEGMTIERIDNNGNYEPGNCRWATRAEQAVNRSSNHELTYNGKTQTVTEWGAEIGVKPQTLFGRIKYGMPIEEILSPDYRRAIEAAHGTISRYTNRKCRCAPCRAAWRQYHRDRRANQ